MFSIKLKSELTKQKPNDISNAVSNEKSDDVYTNIPICKLVSMPLDIILYILEIINDDTESLVKLIISLSSYPSLITEIIKHINNLIKLSKISTLSDIGFETPQSFMYKYIISEPISSLKSMICSMNGQHNWIKYCIKNAVNGTESFNLLKTKQGRNLLYYLLYNHNEQIYNGNSYNALKIFNFLELATISENMCIKDVDIKIFNIIKNKLPNTKISELKKLSIDERCFILRFIYNATCNYTFAYNGYENIGKSNYFYIKLYESTLPECIRLNYLQIIKIVIDNIKFISDNHMIIIDNYNHNENKNLDGTANLSFNNHGHKLICEYIVDNHNTLRQSTACYYLNMIIDKMGYVNAIWKMLNYALSQKNFYMINYLLSFNNAKNSLTHMILDRTFINSKTKIDEFYIFIRGLFDLSINNSTIFNICDMIDFTILQNKLNLNNKIEYDIFINIFAFINIYDITDKNELINMSDIILKNKNICDCKYCLIDFDKILNNLNIKLSLPMIRLYITNIQTHILKHEKICYKLSVFSNYINDITQIRQKCIDLNNLYQYLNTIPEFVNSHLKIKKILLNKSVEIKNGIIENELIEAYMLINTLTLFESIYA